MWLTPRPGNKRARLRYKRFTQYPLAGGAIACTIVKTFVRLQQYLLKKNKQRCTKRSSYITAILLICRAASSGVEIVFSPVVPSLGSSVLVLAQLLSYKVEIPIV